ncbi:unnamed protein product, partial [Strongylus vulgaris]
MLRVLKLYKFGYDREFYPGYATSMASYPGLLYSSDDFALMSSGLAVIETTISVFDKNLFNNTKATGQLPTWIRAIVSNQLARDAREWCKLYAKYNSGTYNNQWYNDYTKDEFSKCNCNPPYSAEAGISARGDLNPANGTYEFPGQGHVNHGALDYKGTNVSLMKKLEFRAQGGPTWGTVPPFKWSTFDF